MKRTSRLKRPTSSNQAVDADGSLVSFQSFDKKSDDERLAFIDSIRYSWASKLDFIWSALTCIFSVDAFDILIQLNPLDPGVYHFIIAVCFFALPVYYMQLLLGQYTQLGVISLKYLSPIAHGVAIVFIMNLFLRTIRQSILLDDAIVYFITSMQSELQWLMCPPKNDREGCQKVPCYDGVVNCSNLLCGNGTKLHLSAEIFYYSHYKSNMARDISTVTVVMPEFQKIAIHGICWFCTCVILICTINHYIKVIKILRVTTMILLLVLILAVTVPNLGETISDLFAIKPESLTNIDAWLTAIPASFEVLAVGRAFHVIHGSYLKPSESWTMYAIIVVILHFGSLVACCLFTTSCIQNVSKYAQIDDEHRHLFFNHGSQVLFVAIPQAIGSMGIPQMWSCLFFAIIIMINISQQLAHLTFIQMSLNDIYPGMVRYKKYGVILFSMSSGLLSCLLLAPESYAVFVVTVRYLPHDSTAMSVILMTFFVCWVYGVQRFCDDIHFITGQPPAMIWRICWYILPFTLIITFVQFKLRRYTYDSVSLLQIVLLGIFTCPVPIVAIVETFKFIKARNLIGLFQPHERFGPPDYKERELRRLFNPRTETRCRRRNQLCKHRCLLGSKPLSMIKENDIESSIGDSHFEDEIIFEELK
ncbi:sodium-dependent dopamine transporter-like [Onthophagus taurus]|uniref:sodium-dependent dopamine transporter-like n=1 Tax=Onthophagus taurus TaxID=166361 RepID=UPI000C208F24|nr:sodium-dependent dopamine transporter-like [Onthophagus taurus]